MATSHYVNNADFLAAIVEYKKSIKEAEKSGLPRPQVTNYIGECILKIANHLSYKPNFINYSYRDEMISDGIENCMQYINNFDPEKSSNPFSYFTQIIYFAFLRRINREKKQSYIKNQLVQQMPFDMFELSGSEEGSVDIDFHNAYMEFLQAHNNFDDSFMKLKEKKKKTPSTSLDQFMENDDE